MRERVPPDQRDRQADWRKRHPPQPPLPAPPPIAPLAAQAQRIIFAANEPTSAMRAPPGWAVALSADLNHPEWATVNDVAALRRQGRRVVSWCDCDATPASAAIALRDRLLLDGWIGQGETSAQLGHALNAGASVIVGNPNAWTDAEREVATHEIERGRFAVTGEMYRPDPGYSAQGVPIASFCYGVGLDAGVYIPLSEYLAASPPGSVQTCCIFHAAAMRDEDWGLL